jgi:hypothetical protein
VAQCVDEIIDRQPDAERGNDHGADSEKHIDRFWIGPGRLIVFGSFGSTIPGVAERTCVP